MEEAGRGAVIKYLPLSRRERQRLLGLDKQTESGIWQTPRLPPPLCSEQFPWRTKMCLSLPACQELHLASGMPALTPHPHIPRGLSSPLL